jgi:sterol desaturase/sphingolipid hydroxylase (fatty acid hydroxylase superfamily)
MGTIESGIDQVFSYLLNIEKRTYWAFLISSGVIAFLVYKVQFHKISFVRYLFSRKIWLSKSAFVDYQLLILNAFLKVLLLSYFAIYGLRFAYEVTYHLEVWFGQPISLSATEVIIYYSITITLAKDFAFFIVHYAAHKTPFLWEFHKVHHSATVLNPFTQYRLHPIEMIINNVVAIFVFALVTGTFDFMSDNQIHQYTLYGIGIFSFLFLSLGANLRHSHVKLRYPAILEKILISPYQHQIHHSSDPKHYNKNMGGKFAIWDLIFGTLVRSKDVKNVKFGLGKENKDYDTFSKNLILSPIKNLAKMINAFKSKR